MTVGRFSLVALDCPDPWALARFYQGILGGGITQDTEDGDWFQLHLDGVDIAFQLDPDHAPPQWPDQPQQAHIDIDVTDLDAAETEVLAIGAVKTEVQPRPDRWRVFLDPAGHPFCLVEVLP